jgi:hypothetical protein
MCEDFAPNFSDKRTSCCITTTHRLTLPFSQGNFFTKDNMTVVSHSPYKLYMGHWDFSLFPQLEIKLKDCHVDTTEVIESESLAVLNILTEHDFQNAFEK